MCVQVTEEDGNPCYSVWNFESGKTFARSYLELFVNNEGISAHVKAITPCQCLLINIPHEMRHEFKSLTRPLWYEELARYFGMSINEAGEALGIFALIYVYIHMYIYICIYMCANCVCRNLNYVRASLSIEFQESSEKTRSIFR